MQKFPYTPHQLAGVAAVLVLFSALVIPASSSEGDASLVFQECHAVCLQTGCTKTPGDSNTCDTACPQHNRHYKPPWSLRLMGWDCSDDCSYHCMWAIEAPKASFASGPVYKYFGKWPFTRVLGAQEIASVLFSIANMLAHIHNIRLYWSHVKLPRGSSKASGHTASHARPASAAAGQYPYLWLWIVYSAVNVNAWLWSSVFHCRDTKITERFDYFSADVAVAVGLAVALVRTLQLQSVLHIAVLGLVVASGVAQHIYYMAFIKFDYGYNMKMCIAIGILTVLAWLVWVTVLRHPGRRILYQFMALVHAAMLLEVLDFPPLLWLFDAHALWHAATVPLTYLWYRFVFADVAWGVCGHSAAPQQSHVLLETAAKQKQ